MSDNTARAAPDISPLIATLHALIAVMEQESEVLAIKGPCAEISELAAAKERLVTRLEGVVAGLFREDARWHAGLDDEARAELATIYNDLHTASVVNSDILERQIDLSSELLAAVGLEIQRLTGRGASTYCSAGQMRGASGKAPISVNTRL